MAIDVEKLKSRLEQLKNPRNKFSRRTWKPKPEGVHSNIRLIEYPHGDDPFVELWFHYGIGSGPSILCPKKNDGKVCPICEFAKTLVDESKGEQDQKLAKKLWPKQRMFAVMIDREDTEPTPKYWGFGTTVYQKLIEHLINPKTGHMMDVDAGIDVEIYQLKNAGQTYPETDFTLDRTDSPLLEGKKKIKEFLSSIVPVEEVFKPMVNEEIKKRLTDWLSFNEDEAEEQSSETTKGSSSQDDVVDDIDSEFEKALANVPA